MNARIAFYQATVSRWIPDRTASVLVVAGGTVDRDVFHALDFRNVVISNLGSDAREDTAPYSWRHENLEALSCRDGEFDYVVVHAGLHHCRSPHRGVLEMYRAARRAMIAFDPPDNFTVRTMQAVGLAQVYECVAVEDHGGAAGGANNSNIPNFIYRWTEREVEKTIRSFAPEVKPRFRYAYSMDAPTPQFTSKSLLKSMAIRVLRPAYWCYGRLLPRQQNLFGFMVEKPEVPDDLHPWLEIEDGRLTFRR